jgi:hypothetical protein
LRVFFDSIGAKRGGGDVEKVIIPAGIGIILSIAWAIYERGKVARWMNKRKLQAWNEEQKVCPSCGAGMIPATRETTGEKVWYCKRWKVCKTYIDAKTGGRIKEWELTG